MAEEKSYEEMKKDKDYILPGSILVAALLISGSIIYVLGNGQTGNTGDDMAANTCPYEISELASIIDRDEVLGDPNAPVTFITYGDYQCPFCGRLFAEVEGPLVEKYVKNGLMSLVYRNYAFLGPESVAAAEAAECARDQGKFWEYHDALYIEEIQDGQEHNGNLNRGLFMQIAQDEGLDTAQFAQCIDGRKYADLIQEDDQCRALVGVDATPTSLINGQLVRGLGSLAQFESAIQSLLSTEN